DVARASLGRNVERLRNRLAGCDFGMIGHPKSLDNDRLIAFRPDRHHRNRLSHKLADPFEVGSSTGWQFVVISATGDFFVPARESFVNGLGASDVVDMAWKPRGLLSIDFVSGANLQLFEAAQYIEQHHRDRIDSAQPACVADAHRVQPTTTPRS